jgi:o-succinylbenzoate synthase
LQLKTDAGIVGLGEASPLPQGDAGSLRDVSAILAGVRASLRGKRVDEIEMSFDEFGQDCQALAAVRCALDVAVCDVRAKAAGITVAEFLAPHISRSVIVNATIGALSTTAARKAALKAQAAGFGCVKLKAGMARSVDEECERVATVRAALGSQAKLRLDANGAWEVEQAIRTIRALERYSIEFVEQPVRADDVAGLKRVRDAVCIPIAADESITSYETARDVLQFAAAQILVLKPMVIGGLRPARQIIELAQAAGVTVVVTTTIDAGVGTAAALHLAATLPVASPACGLATGDLLADDLLVRLLVVNDGRMILPEEPGLGIELDPTALRRYSLSGKEICESVRRNA